MNEIIAVCSTEPEPGGPFAAFAIDSPLSGSTVSGRKVPIAGWVIGASRPAVAIEVSCETKGEIRVFARLPCDLPRPDVESAYPDFPNAGRSGFEGSISFLSPPATRLRLQAVLDARTRAHIGTIDLQPGPENLPSDVALVSAVIPCYKQAHFLGDSIESVLAQNHPRLEVLVVDDGSPDNTEEIARRFPGVRYLRQKNRGLAGARNAGLRNVLGDFVIFLDADDRLAPGAIESSLVYFRENPRYGLVAGHFRHIGLDGEELAVPERRAPTGNPYAALLADYSVGPPGAILFRRQVFAKVGSFDSSISPAADYDMSLRVAREYPIRTHDKIVLDYRRHGANMSGNPANMLSTTVRALRKQWPEARKSPETRRAYREGMRHWRGSWGRFLVEKVRSDLSKRRYRRAAREAWTLLRYHPGGLISALTEPKDARAD